MIIGTTVKITSEMSLVADTVVIDIYDPNGVIQITAAAMTDDGNLFWSYLYESDDADTAGMYKAIVTATLSSKESKSKHFFKLNDQNEEVG